MIRSERAIPLDDALGIVDRALSDSTISSRKVVVRDGLGQILAADQFSRLQLPPFDKASMDGYAVLAGDVRDSYKVLETVMAGSTPTPGFFPPWPSSRAARLALPRVAARLFSDFRAIRWLFM
jgi:molybdopterin biosynthesis enzyme